MRPGILGLAVALVAGVAVLPIVAQPEGKPRFSAPEAPPEDRARVFVIAGGMPQDVYVNGTKIGAMGGNETMIFDVHPAEYAFSWRSADPGLIVATTVEPRSVKLAGGTTVALSAQVDGMVARMQIVVLIYDARTDNSRPTVRPTSCPPSICV